MLLAFVVGLVALVVSSFSSPLADFVGNFLVIVSAVLFLVPILLYWSRGSGGGSGPRTSRSAGAGR